jgi:hypothetical protein
VSIANKHFYYPRCASGKGNLGEIPLQHHLVTPPDIGSLEKLLTQAA